jgi:gas vesicle protein
MKSKSKQLLMGTAAGAAVGALVPTIKGEHVSTEARVKSSAVYAAIGLVVTWLGKKLL